MMQKFFQYPILVFVIVLTVNYSSALLAANDVEEAVQLDWDALIPKDWNPENLLDQLSSGNYDQLSDNSPEAQQLLDKVNELNASAPVVQELNGKIVKLPGFMVPLDMSDKGVTEFLLVPYFGACIHTPPPPANQIVYGKSEKPLQLEGGMFAPIWMTGKMSTVSVDSGLAEAGYTMDVYEIAPYVIP